MTLTEYHINTTVITYLINLFLTYLINCAKDNHFCNFLILVIFLLLNFFYVHSY